MLVKCNVKILISLDGNQTNNSYRVFKNGLQSFNQVEANIEIIKIKYPEYFKTNISFNTVINSKNSLKEVHNYFKTKFNKVPELSEISKANLNKRKVNLFSSLYKNIYAQFDFENCRSKYEKLILKDFGAFKNVNKYFLQYFDIYLNLSGFINKADHKNVFIPSGTCPPFSLKIFITSSGSILQCERISHKYSLGAINKNEIKLEFDEIEKKFINYFKIISPICDKCYKMYSCPECLFNFIETKSCPSFTDKSEYDNLLKKNLYRLEKTKNDINKSLLKIKLPYGV